MIESVGDFAKHIFKKEHDEVANDWAERGAERDRIRWMTYDRIDWEGRQETGVEEGRGSWLEINDQKDVV